MCCGEHSLPAATWPAYNPRHRIITRKNEETTGALHGQTWTTKWLNCKHSWCLNVKNIWSLFSSIPYTVGRSGPYLRWVYESDFPPGIWVTQCISLVSALTCPFTYSAIDFVTRKPYYHVRGTLSPPPQRQNALFSQNAIIFHRKINQDSHPLPVLPRELLHRKIFFR